MSSPEYLRRHYGEVAREYVDPRLSVPTNLARRTAEITGIYENPSLPVAVELEAPKSPSLINLQSAKTEAGFIHVDFAQVNPWAKGTSNLRATGTNLVRPVDIMVVPKSKAGIPLVVKEPEPTIEP